MPHYLLALDFDGTAARTFDESPNHMTVGKAYDLAVAEVLGKEAQKNFVAEGGHKNRTPSEIVTGLIGKSSNELIEQLVTVKMNYLLSEIGPEWPKPCVGFIDFWEKLSQLKQETNIRTAIISSGHTAFIKKTFQVWNIEEPDYLVTEDDVRPRKYPKGLENRFKPGTLQLAIAHRDWLMDTMDRSYRQEDAVGSKRYMFYIGDDKVKDHGLAEKAKIGFGLFRQGYPFEYREDGFVFGDWITVASLLNHNARSLHEGRPFNEIFSFRPLVRERMQGERRYI